MAGYAPLIGVADTECGHGLSVGAGTLAQGET